MSNPEYYTYIQQFFKRWASFYDISVCLISGLRKTVVETTAAYPGARILDVATGTGKQAFAFASKGYIVVGTDICGEMLGIAIRNNKYDNLAFKIADAAALPYADSQFDVSCISFALHDMPAEIREKVIPEMARVTRPGGMVVVVDYALPANRLHRALVYRFTRLYESIYYQDFVHTNLPALLRQNGLQVVDCRSVLAGGGCIYRAINEKIR